MLHGSKRALVAAAAALAVSAPSAGAASLYDGPGPRPGPDILYADAPRAPQLENAGPWSASPILVSGATAYRDGEFLYQDFIYDDHGARGRQRDENDPREGDDTFSGPNGTYTYPSNPAYAQNAADLVELRVKPGSGETLFRLTLNTLNDPALVGATIAIGDSPVALPMPHGANVRVPAQYFLTWHGGTAELIDAATGTPVGPAPGVVVNTERRQVELRVPHAAFNPGTGKVKLAAGVGLWDNAANAYLKPSANSNESTPGGAFGLAASPAFFNVAFRRNDQEPQPPHGSPEVVTDPSWWRDRAQSEALESGDISAFRAEVDFGRLAAGANDDGGVPQTGALNRIYASQFETKPGVDFDEECGQPTDCKGELRGRLQPYAIYVPGKRGANGYGLTLLLHSLGANYNQFLGSRNQSQFGERGPGSIVITPSGRGPDSWYYGEAGADTFEVWADVARRYPLDAAYTAVAGYSMGGYGTYKFSTQYPDLFARAQPTVGPPGLGIATTPDNPQPGGRKSSTFPMLGSLRHIPIQMWVGTTDELVPYQSTVLHARGIDALDYRYEFWSFAPADHFALAVYDQYQPAADFLGDHRVDRDPAHVTFVRNPTMDFPGSGQVANHAYWLSGVEVANASDNDPFGTIDVRSEAFGTGDPEATGTLADAGVLTGGNTLPGIGYQRQRKEWGDVPATPRRNRLVIDATNISTVTIDPKRARVNCNVELAVTSDTPIVVRLTGCRSRSFGQSARCGAKGRPRSSLSRRGITARRTRVAAGGRAVAFRCVRNRVRRGTVARVQVAVARKSGRRCQFMSSRGRLGKTRSCNRTVWVRARLGRQRGGKVPWTLRKNARLPRGVYELRVRAIDKTGTVERAPRRQGRKTIRIR